MVTVQANEPVQAYQATFDTEPGDWVTVKLPWHEFVPVKMASWNPDAAPLDPAKIRSLGLVYSRFDLNGIANPNYKPGTALRPAPCTCRGGSVRQHPHWYARGAALLLLLHVRHVSSESSREALPG